MDGFRVVTTTYVFVEDPEEAYDLAIKGRGEGKRTEIITEDEYSGLTRYIPKMQDLLEWRRKYVLHLPS